MSSTPAKRLPAEQRRALIEQSAAKLFSARGFDGARLDEIAAGAGVSKPILYRHFGSKRDLYLALLSRHRDDLASLAADDAGEGTMQERLEAVIERWFAYVEARPETWPMIFRDSGGDAGIRAFRVQVQTAARAVLATMIASWNLGIADGEREALAELLRTGLAGLALYWIDNPEVPRATVAAAAGRVIGGLVEGAERSRPAG